MGHLKSTGIVLRETGYKESDKILTVLLKDIGKMTLKASGCRKQGSKLGAATQIFTYSEMTISEYREMHRLSEAEIQSQFYGLRNDLDLLSLAQYFCEVIEFTSTEGQEENEQLSLLLNSLYALETLKKPKELVKAGFEWKLSAILGYEPMADACAVCGEKHPESPMFNIEDGVVHCRKCRDQVGQGVSIPLTPQALLALQHIIYGDPKRLFSFKLDEESMKNLGEASEQYLLHQLDRRFRALDFYKQIAF